MIAQLLSLKPRRDGAPSWMVTFADLMALLLALFVLLLSFSEVDSDSFRRNAGPISEAFNSKNILQITSPVSPVATTRSYEIPRDDTDDTAQAREFARNRLFDVLRDALAREIAGRQVELVAADNAVIIRFPDRFAFAPGSSDLSAAAGPSLDRIAAVLAQAKGRIEVAGHTDSEPIATARFRSNWDLSSARAVSVVHRLLRQKGIDRTRVSAEGFAETRPLAANDTPEHRARNRRVEITVEIPLKGGDHNALQSLFSKPLFTSPSYFKR